MNKPLISVIVPVYKVEAYLERCVSSIRNQTYQNLEILLVDDGSPDRCGEMCDALAAQDTRIRVIHKENGGLSDARNAGLDAMRGEYVCFVDSDDWIGQNTCALLLERLQAENADISCGGIVTHDGSRILSYFNPNLQECFTYDRQGARRELLNNRIITNSVCDKLYKAGIFRELRFKTGILYEDFQIQPLCLERADRVTYTAQTCYYYFVASNSISRGAFTKRQLDFLTNSLERIAYYEKNDPACLPACMAAHLDICLGLISKAYGTPVWKEVRGELTAQLSQPLPKMAEAALPKKLRFKRTLFKCHPFLYIVFARIYQRLGR